MPPEDPYALVGATLERRFAVERVVARGGFGVVYRATHLTLRRPIALKVLFVPDALTPEQRRIFLEGFALEAQTIAALDHPAIVRAFDFGVSAMPSGSEAPWMALEWIEGTPLSEVIKARGGRPMSPAEALTTLRPVIEALAFAHESGVAHRDVKPSNIMLSTASRASKVARGGGARLLDFGIAKVMGGEREVGTGETRTEGLFAAFSLPYASPEQRSATRTGPWTDVHALGLILTELVTGRRPYPSGSRLDIEAAILAALRPTPATFGVDVGPWEAVIARALALRPPDRFPDAGALLAALDAHVPAARVIAPNVRGDTEPMPRGPSVPGQTITAPPVISIVPPPPRTRWLRRAATAATALALVTLGATLAISQMTPAPAAPPPASPAPDARVDAPASRAPDAAVEAPVALPVTLPPERVDAAAPHPSPGPSGAADAGGDRRGRHRRHRRREALPGAPGWGGPAAPSGPTFRLPD